MNEREYLKEVLDGLKAKLESGGRISDAGIQMRIWIDNNEYVLYVSMDSTDKSYVQIFDDDGEEILEFFGKEEDKMLEDFIRAYTGFEDFRIDKKYK